MWHFYASFLILNIHLLLALGVKHLSMDIRLCCWEALRCRVVGWLRSSDAAISHGRLGGGLGDAVRSITPCDNFRRFLRGLSLWKEKLKIINKDITLKSHFLQVHLDLTLIYKFNIICYFFSLSHDSWCKYFRSSF